MPVMPRGARCRYQLADGDAITIHKNKPLGRRATANTLLIYLQMLIAMCLCATDRLTGTQIMSFHFVNRKERNSYAEWQM